MNVLMGVWLFLSTFLWAHTTAQMVNALIVGALLVTFGLLGTRVPNVCRLNSVLAVWLFISAFVLPRETIARAGALTLSTSIFIAIVVFIFSLPALEDMTGCGPSRPTQQA